jgi:hypothetical protein
MKTTPVIAPLLITSVIAYVALSCTTALSQFTNDFSIEGTEDALQLAYIGSISVTGGVRNIDGLPLSEVTLITHVRGAHEPFLLETTQSVNGSYMATCSNCAGISLSFSKHDFYDEEVSVDFHAEVYVDKTTREFKRFRSTLDTNIEVTLQQKGAGTVLSGISGRLEYYDNRAAMIIDFSRAYDNLFVMVTNIHNSSDLPNHSLYLSADADSEGKIAIGSNQVPLNEKIIMTTKTDGFIEFNTSGIRRDKVFRQMTIAPTNGYSSYLDVGNACSDIYFYCRVNNKYGKGCVGAGVKGEGSDKIFAFIELQMQPDGSTYLEAVQGW